jgi:transcriptional regulator with XRE-family HTH domain
MEQKEISFDVVLDAGMTQGDLAKLAGVSRLTANKWMRGQFKPHRLHEDKVASLLQTIATRLAEGKLPVSPRLKGTARHDAVIAVVRGV